jgi:hypothetical protein
LDPWLRLSGRNTIPYVTVRNQTTGAALGVIAVPRRWLDKIRRCATWQLYGTATPGGLIALRNGLDELVPSSKLKDGSLESRFRTHELDIPTVSADIDDASLAAPTVPWSDAREARLALRAQTLARLCVAPVIFVLFTAQIVAAATNSAVTWILLGVALALVLLTLYGGARLMALTRRIAARQPAWSGLSRRQRQLARQAVLIRLSRRQTQREVGRLAGWPESRLQRRELIITGWSLAGSRPRSPASCYSERSSCSAKARPARLVFAGLDGSARARGTSPPRLGTTASPQYSLARAYRSGGAGWRCCRSLSTLCA